MLLTIVHTHRRRIDMRFSQFVVFFHNLADGFNRDTLATNFHRLILFNHSIVIRRQTNGDNLIKWRILLVSGLNNFPCLQLTIVVIEEVMNGLPFSRSETKCSDWFKFFIKFLFNLIGFITYELSIIEFNTKSPFNFIEELLRSLWNDNIFPNNVRT